MPDKYENTCDYCGVLIPWNESALEHGFDWCSKRCFELYWHREEVYQGWRANEVIVDEDFTPSIH